jgi:SAM-dependent MidA family methyltransferase
MTEPTSLTSALHKLLQRAIQAGGWIGFDRFMALALYAPGLGYYANDSAPSSAPCRVKSGSDFVTAPELTPLFGQALAVQVAEALAATGTHEVWEFGAGSGALALQLLDALGDRVQRYTIVDLSGSLRARQQTLLAGMRTSAVGGRAARAFRAWWWATRCSMPCRSSCWCARAGTRAGVA